jgi:membrane-bound lytic murein transglycosylase B
MQIKTPLRLVLISFFVFGLTACAATTPTKKASAQLDEAGFNHWKQDFTQRAVQVRDPVAVQNVMRTVQFQPRLVELDRKQPESQLTLQQYIERTVSADRINKGRAHLAENRAVLNRVAAQTGVPASVIVALWGKESSYGAFTGGVKVGDALATMSYEGRRRDMFEKELLAFIDVVQRLGKDPNDLKGSWAGAMGQCQFMPSSYLRYAADGDGDHKADIWFSKPDVFASAANFLKQSGWQAGQPIAQSIRLPANINPAALGRDKQPRPMRDWIQGGVTVIGQTPADLNIPTKLYAPDGVNGPAFILYPNFDVLLRWNNSGYFGVGIALLSAQLSQTP